MRDDLLRFVSRRVRESAPVLALRQRLYERRFATTQGWRNLARGVYADFEEARRSAPPSMPTGYYYDDELYARNAVVEPHDYPAMFWLRDELERGCTLLDLGGHVGTQYYLYGKHVRFAPSLRWIVSEQAHVTSLGRRMAEERTAPHLSFVEAVDGIAADVFLCAGCLQYIDEPFGVLLGRLARRPRAILLNKVPLYDRETRVTVQNTGHSFTPCRLFNGAELIGSIEELGYRLVDRWRVLDRSMRIPFHREYDVPTYSGLYFERDGGGAP